MGTSSGRICFLTRVSGTFGTNRYVSITNSNGVWWLGGSSAGVSAQARCRGIFTATPPTEYSWSQGQNPVLMGSIKGRACFLTRVGGDFEGTSERVEVFSGNSTSWWLGGSSTQAGVHAKARCVIYPYYLPQQPYSYTAWIPSGVDPKILGSSNWGCYLAGMSGDFEGSNSFVEIFEAGPSWMVKASAQVFPTRVKAGCTHI
jgi:hypothetical protein